MLGEEKEYRFMYNKILEPLLADDPKRTLTKTGIQIRKVFYPIFRKIIPFTVRRKMVVISRGKIPKKEPIIFVSTHEFREDAEAAYLAAGKVAFIVNGSVSIVMNSFDGITNWIVGMILVNRADKDSRKAVKNKMIYALRMGESIILYPEGTWNKSPNQIISGLFPGVYEVARATGCPIVPMAHQREGELIYSKVGDAFDISGMSRYKAMETVKEQLSTLKYELMETCGQVKRKYLPVGIEAENYWKEYINALMAEVPLYDYELEKYTKWVDKDVTAPTEAFSFFKRMKPSKYNAFLYRGNIQYMI